MTISVIINGANGRMGQQTVQAIINDNTFKLLATFDREDNLAQGIQQLHPDIVIDFTDAAAVYDNVLTIIKQGARPVIGTTGLVISQILELQQLARDHKCGGIIAPNFSIAAVLMMRFAREAAHYLSQVEIIEMHHDRKLDAPSGTAMKTAQMISEVLTNKEPTNSEEQEILKGARGAQYNNIPIHAVRLPGLLAHQQVIFGSLGETLTIRHDTLSRECFMPGVLLSCKKVMTLDNLIYGLENIL